MEPAIVKDRGVRLAEDDGLHTSTMQQGLKTTRPGRERHYWYSQGSIQVQRADAEAPDKRGVRGERGYWCFQPHPRTSQTKPAHP